MRWGQNYKAAQTMVVQTMIQSIVERDEPLQTPPTSEAADAAASTRNATEADAHHAGDGEAEVRTWDANPMGRDCQRTGGSADAIGAGCLGGFRWQG